MIKTTIKNNICNDDESDDEDYEYVKNGVKVSSDEYYNKNYYR